jgi:uncharacterized protein YndB with AHSA1/START domain
MRWSLAENRPPRSVDTRSAETLGIVHSVRMYTTRVARLIRAPRAEVYAALIEANAIARWRVPDGMSSYVHNFDAREGGEYRISLTYERTDQQGKTGAHTDTYHGRFLRLVPNEQVVEELEFETDDPLLKGAMTMTTTLSDADGGTEIVVVHEAIPDAIPASDNELGTRMALANLARLLEPE